MSEQIEQEAGGDAAAEVSWRDADQQLRRLAARRAALDLEEAHWLVVARRTRVHAHLGMGSFLEYVERVLGYRPHTARERLRTAEALAGLPATRGALAEGRIAFSAVRELTRILTPETEEVWLDTVAGRTIREVEAAVAGRSPGDLPWDRRDPQLRPRVLRLELSPATYATFLEVRRELEREVGHALDDDALMATLCRRELARGAGESDATAGARPPHQVAVTICEDCQRGWQDGGNQSIEVSANDLERLRCDAVEIGRVDAEQPVRAAQTVPPATRRLVIARDHGRCTVPGCRASHDVDVHHLRWRSRGGSHEPSNLILLCGTHHTAVHEGLLVISGTSPGRLVFAHADGRAYGAAPADVVVGRADVDAEAQARAAVASARSHVGADASLEGLVTAALRAAAPASRIGEGGLAWRGRTLAPAARDVPRRGCGARSARAA